MLDCFENIRKHKRTSENTNGAEPMPHSERVLKVNDGNNQTGEFAQCENKCHSQRSAFGSENEHRADTHVLCECVEDQIKPNDWH